MWTPVFSIGFGPRRFSIVLGKFWQTEFRISPIPLGGYVAIPELGDETNAEEVAKMFGEEPRELKKFAVWKRMCVAVAGVVMNILFAVVLVFGLYAIKGAPVAQVTSIFVASLDSQNAIARNAGLQPQDVIVGVDNVKTVAPITPDMLTKQLIAHKGEEVVLHIKRQGQDLDVKVVPNQDGRIGVGIGVTQNFAFAPMSASEAGARSVSVTWDGLGKISYAVAGMLHIVTPTAGAEPHSIVAIFQVGADAWNAGLVQFINILFSLSLNLAVFNILPLPMLDGGYVVFFTIEALRGRPLSAETQNKLKTACLWLILMLFIWGVFNDFAHPIK
jgi:regulator of sigma E protease